MRRKQELPTPDSTDCCVCMNLSRMKRPCSANVAAAQRLNFQMHQISAGDCKASEQSARMVAMKNATDNAKQIIKGDSDAGIQAKRLRQANITKELLEITTAQMAVG